ncbi:CHAP domain-containing protein [Streptomyces sp. NBC_01022]|uniref:CHAP domain-containing protein n=1 Tax=Streptomyces sp. NBC_01022 TaxID=2903723 RepID=UPI002DD87137|nr:CHAP domain-containing protein [Streptomyces sp. NBC_01022]WRZ84860.1 CHAP domain-containing protein [Streptomyces sp. NBC_01022]
MARVLKGEVGYREGFSGGHWNNKQKYSAAVPGLAWSDYQAWCCTFTSWAFQTAGLPKGSYPVTASCATATSWWKQRGRWSEYPALGAQVMFGPGGGSHTGIVIGYDDTTITTIEGNTNASGSAEGDGVYRKTRQRQDTYVYGYGYPDYPGGITSADPTWKNPIEEDPMAGMTKADIYDAVWRTDAIAAPSDAADHKTNPNWQPQSILKDVQSRVRALTASQAAQTAAIKTLAGLVGKGVDTAAVVAAVERAIESAVIDVNINSKEA